MNFDAEDWQKRVSWVKKLTGELVRYVSNLKKIVSGMGGKLLPKVLKLVRNRVQLYQVIQDMYE